VDRQRNAEAPGHRLLERPLGPRSVIASLLLGRHPPRARVGLLVRWCALFGIGESATRVALSRMVERSELTADDGTYELAGRVRRRQQAQDAALRVAPGDTSDQPWNGGWRLEVVTGTDRSAADRRELRAAAAHLRLAALREGVWTRPDNLPPVADDPDAAAVVRAQCTSWRGAPLDGDPRAMASDLFAIGGLADRGTELLTALGEVVSRLPHGVDGEAPPGVLADAFEVGAAAAQHLRRDPLLPSALLPPQWPGDALRARYATYERVFGEAVAGWARRHG
jgi:phenylacetic acid degradation operon negative regulatory protein